MFFSTLVILLAIESFCVVHERILAGFPVSNEQLHAYLPRQMKYIAYSPAALPSMTMLELLPEYSQRTQIRELPGFRICDREQNQREENR